MSTIKSKRPRVKMALSDLLIRKAKPEERNYSLNDGDGLSLLVEPNGSKGWRVRYTLNSKPRFMSFGVYPDISLQEARERLRGAKTLVSQGKCPQLAKQENKAKLAFDAANTFKNVADNWYNEKVTEFSPKHQRKVKLL